MMDIILKNKIVLAAAALVIAGAIWYGFSSGSNQEAVLEPGNSASGMNEQDKDIVSKLIELDDVKLEGKIFLSTVFLGLKDFNTEILDEPQGRPEPFAPLPTVAANQSASTPTKSAPQTASKPASKPASQPTTPASGSGSGGSQPLFVPLD